MVHYSLKVPFKIPTELGVTQYPTNSFFLIHENILPIFYTDLLWNCSLQFILWQTPFLWVVCDCVWAFVCAGLTWNMRGLLSTFLNLLAYPDFTEGPPFPAHDLHPTQVFLLLDSKGSDPVVLSLVIYFTQAHLFVDRLGFCGQRFFFFFFYHYLVQCFKTLTNI